MNKGTILCVDDDDGIISVLNHYFEDEGYNVLSAENAAQAIEKSDHPDINVILLDLGLPDSDGLSLIPVIKNKSRAAIIVVSGKSDTTEKIICLEMGADDYITKPFELRELSARIKAVLRRSESASPSTSDKEKAQTRENIKFGNGWILDRLQYQLYNKDNLSAELTTGEFKLLEALVLSSNRALSREHLFDLTRDGNYESYDRAIDIQIARIRKKLVDDDNSESLIKTVRGVGYMFCGKVA